MSLIDELEKLQKKMNAIENEAYMIQFELFALQQQLKKLKENN